MSIRAIKNIFIREDSGIDEKRLGQLAKIYNKEGSEMNPELRKEYNLLFSGYFKWLKEINNQNAKDMILIPYFLVAIFATILFTATYSSYLDDNGIVHKLLVKKVALEEVKTIDFYADDNGNRWLGNNHGEGDKWMEATSQVYSAPFWKGKNGKIYSNRDEARKN